MCVGVGFLLYVAVWLKAHFAAILREETVRSPLTQIRIKLHPREILMDRSRFELIELLVSSIL